MIGKSDCIVKLSCVAAICARLCFEHWSVLAVPKGMEDDLEEMRKSSRLELFQIDELQE